MRSIDRRGFLEIVAGVTAGLTLSGCASVAVTRVIPIGGVVRLPVRNFPQLAQIGGYLKLQPQGMEAPIYVLARPDGSYTALSPICTHLGCTVNIEGPHLVCPCHGSTYDRNGEVLRGPAERALRRFKVTGSGEEIVIQLEGTV